MTKAKYRFDKSDYISRALLHSDDWKETYSIGRDLTTDQVRFAAAYEVAKRRHISIQEAEELYSLFECDLPSSMQINKEKQPTRKQIHNTISRKFVDAISAATNEKPAVLLVNFRIDASKNPGESRFDPGAKHWVPVIITKDIEGAVTLTTINSSTSPAFNTSELNEWLTKVATNARNSDLAVSIVHISRDVQVGRVCGLSAANAVGVAVNAINNGHPTIDNGLFDGEISGGPDNLEEHYSAQGTRIFSALRFLAYHKEDRETAIDIVEGRMLISSAEDVPLDSSSVPTKSADSPGGFPSSSPVVEDPYKIVLSEKTLNDINEYKLYLANEIKPGAFLAEVLRKKEYTLKEIGSITTEEFIELLLATKRPQFFAETSIKGDGSDWNTTELKLLGDINVIASVTIYDNGVWGRGSKPKEHTPPFEGELLFTPGVLLRGDKFIGELPDLVEVTKIKKGRRVIDQEAYNAVVERRLLPLLAHANSRSTPEKPAMIVLPGIGCGAFAGDFKGRMASYLDKALVALLEKHKSKFPNIGTVYFDPFNECDKRTETIGGINYHVEPSRGTKPQLSHPAVFGADPSKCTFFKIVAWDHVSLPGNDYFINIRDTDDGAAGAATNIMQVITGVEGNYSRKGYRPPEPYTSWEWVAKEKNVRLETTGRVMVLKEDGQYVKLHGNELSALPVETSSKPKHHVDVSEVPLTEASVTARKLRYEFQAVGTLEELPRAEMPHVRAVHARYEDVTRILSAREIVPAAAYEIAKRLHISLAEVYVRYNLEVVELPTVIHRKNAYATANRLGIKFSDALKGFESRTIEFPAEKNTKDIAAEIIDRLMSAPGLSKPTIIMVQYCIYDNDKSKRPEVPYWVPIVVTKSPEGEFSISLVNSSTTEQFQTKEILHFAEQLAGGARVNNCSRDVLNSKNNLLCGLAAANASGIAMELLSQREELTRAAFESQEVDRLISKPNDAHNLGNVPYNIQGRKTFAILQYLTNHPEAEESDIFEVEEEALIESGILTTLQASSPYMNSTLEKEEIKRIFIDGMSHAVAELDRVDFMHYNTGYALSEVDIKFALAYEVAKLANTSLLEVYKLYNLYDVPLQPARHMEPQALRDLELRERNTIESIMPITTPNKPTILLVNYRTGGGGMHWVPVVVSKNAAGEFSVTAINSSTSHHFRTDEFDTYLDTIRVTLQSGGSAVAFTDASRNVQTGQICGLATVNACKIALGNINRGVDLQTNVFVDAEADRLYSAKTQEVSYCVQAVKTFAVMKHLSKHPEKIEANATIVERDALVDCDILTRDQIDSGENIDKMLAEREELRIEITKLIKKTKLYEVEKMSVNVKDFIKHCIFHSATAKGFDVKLGKMNMEAQVAKMPLATPSKRGQADTPAGSSKKPRNAGGVKVPAAQGDKTTPVKRARTTDVEGGSFKRTRDEGSPGYAERPEHPAADGLGEMEMRTPVKRVRPHEMVDDSSSKKRKGVEGTWGLGWDAEVDSSAERTVEMGGGYVNADPSFKTPLKSNLLVPVKTPWAPKKRKPASTPSKATIAKRVEKERLVQQTRDLEDLYSQKDRSTLDLKGLEFIAVLLSSDDPSLIERYHSEGGDIDFADSSGKTLLMYAVDAHKSHYINELLDLPVELESRDETGKTALGLAVEKGYLPAVIALLINGANINNITYTPLPQLTPLQSAFSYATSVARGWFSSSPVKAKGALITPEVDSVLRTYTANPVKWLSDNNAKPDKIEKFILSNPLVMTPAMKESAVCDLANKGEFVLVADILRISPDMSFLRTPGVIGVLNSDFTMDKIRGLEDKQMRAAHFIMEKASVVCAPGEISFGDALTALRTQYGPPDRER